MLYSPMTNTMSVGEVLFVRATPTQVRVAGKYWDTMLYSFGLKSGFKVGEK